MLRKQFLFLFFSLFVAGMPALDAQSSSPSANEIEGRVSALLAKLSLQQKVDLVTGGQDMYLHGAPSIGMPRIKFSDGPTGVRVWGPSTAYPAGIALAASWDPQLVEKVGHSLGKDSRARGVHILLAPGMNIYRAPMGGRNFEYFGEDPFLASKIAVAYIRGVQAEDVIATAKHYVANDSEYNRHNVNAIIDERTLREIYLPPFEASVKDGHVAAVMDSYNLVNGFHSTQNDWMNNQVLKKDWGFDGILMSDWDATYDGIAAANAGLDLEMPTAKFMNRQTLLDGVKSGAIKESVIDDKVRRFLRVFLRFGFFDKDQEDLNIPLYREDARDLDLTAAREGMVLLKNNGVLPLAADRLKTIAVIGPDAFPSVSGGGGSSYTTPFTASSFLTGLSDAWKGKVRVLYDRGLPSPESLFRDTNFLTPDGKPGLRMETYPNPNFEGTPAVETVRSLNRWRSEGGGQSLQAKQSIRWKGSYVPAQTGKYFILAAASGRDTYRVSVDGREVIAQNRLEGQAPQSAEVELTANRPVGIQVDYVPDAQAIRIGLGIKSAVELISPEAKKIAAQADAVILSIGFDNIIEGEGHDRSFTLPWGQAILIDTIAATNPKTVVNVTAGGGFETEPWLGKVAALIHNWYPGQEGGRALAEILFGTSSPEGKLPISMEQKWEDNPVHDSYYPNTTGPGKATDVKFTEGLMVGYRYYTTEHKHPLFPFGFGLSYTSFAFSDLRISTKNPTADSLDRNKVTVSFQVKNTGAMEGAEVAQVYVSNPSAKVQRPERELKGFEKVRLKPGESTRVSVELDARAFSYYDISTHQWKIDPGQFRILVGDSSENTPLTEAISIQ